MCTGKRSEKKLGPEADRAANAQTSSRSPIRRVSKSPQPNTKDGGNTIPKPKMRVIDRTVKTGTTVRGQQRTQSAAPSRRRRQSARMGRRSGTSSLRIASNLNTGSGNLNY